MKITGKKINKYFKKLKGGEAFKVLYQSLEFRADKLCMLVMKHICASKPLKNIIVLESHNDFDSNTGAFYDYLIKHHYNRKYKIIWRTKNKAPENLPENVYCFNIIKPGIKKAYYICAAKYWFYGDSTMKKVRAGGGSNKFLFNAQLFLA